MSEETPKEFELTDAQRECVANWLKEKWKVGTLCPLCGKGPWNVPPYVVVVRAARPARIGDLYLAGPAYPLVPISCANCTNTVFVNAMLIPGVLPTEVTNASE